MSEADPGRNSRTRAGFIPTCIAAACGPCASTPASAPRRKAIDAIVICCRKGTPDLSVAFDLPTQMGLDSDHPLAAGEVGRVGVAICSLADMERLFDGIRARSDHHVDDHQFDRGDSAVALRSGRAAPGRQRAQALGHHSERHFEGVHRARHLYLSAAPGDAHHHRSVRVGGRRTAGVEHDFDQRLSHSRGRIDRRFRKSRSRWPMRSRTSRRR